LHLVRECPSDGSPVIGKAEHLADGANPRFVVTNLTEDDEQVYLTYCGRGQAENYIKAFKPPTSSACRKSAPRAICPRRKKGSNFSYSTFRRA
jgi:hypothetical protein